jgi:hypothetical protein
LFQKGVAVCEGDPDRAIYQTVAHSEVRADGGEDVLFIHANGKDAIATPVSLLRKTGTPVCAIVDIDVLNSEKVLRNLLEALSVKGKILEQILGSRKEIAELVDKTPEEQLLASLGSSVKDWLGKKFTDLRQARKTLESAAQRASSKWAAVKAKGLDYFDTTNRKAVKKLIETCSSLGLFIVSKGELEGWMSLSAAKGKEWNRKALEQLHEGKCPSDLRDFIAAIVKFLATPSGSIDDSVAVEADSGSSMRAEPPGRWKEPSIEDLESK